jgi:TonB family protein
VEGPAPVKKSGPAPGYPVTLGKSLNGLTGLVFVAADVDAKGRVRKAEVVGSIAEFDDEALKAVKKWTFTPAMANGQAVDSTTTLTLKFGVASDQDVTDAIDIARFLYTQGRYSRAEAALAQVSNAFAQVEMLARSREERKADAKRHGGLIQPGWFGAGAYYPGDDIAAPIPTFRPLPLYTPAAMAQKIMGTIEVDAIVSADGRVGDLVITNSLDRVYGLDAAAMVAAKGWRFKPGHDRNGTPVPVLVTLVFDLKLH